MVQVKNVYGREELYMHRRLTVTETGSSWVDGRRTADSGAIPLAVRKLCRDEVAAFWHEACGDGDGLVVERKVPHELLEGGDALRVEDLDGEGKAGLGTDVADDDVKILRLQWLNVLSPLFFLLGGSLCFRIIFLP